MCLKSGSATYNVSIERYTIIHEIRRLQEHILPTQIHKKKLSSVNERVLLQTLLDSSENRMQKLFFINSDLALV